ncbi:MAG: GGDEF domain-containing protein [Gammaproteobacteria bacterium]|nr:GGDEF domain-containing protein [Gammaproteobacteria bacterium]
MVEVSQGRSEEEIHDPLTGLANQQEFMQRLESALESARSGGNKHAVCYMDLNQFRRVNESLGRAAGDELLRQLAGRMREAVRQSDTLARVESDEFGLLLRGCPREMAVKICSSLRQVIEDFEFTWDGEKLQVGVSMGLVPVTAQSGYDRGDGLRSSRLSDSHGIRSEPHLCVQRGRSSSCATPR